MKPLEMIAEWRKGCSNAGPEWERCYPDRKPSEDRRSPAACIECTAALIETLEKVLREPNDEMEDAGMTEADKQIPGVAVGPIWRAMAGAQP
jgi:hypothetical protein